MLSSAFHDKQLTSISVAGDILTIDITNDEKITKIRMSGLVKLKINDFKESNIINETRLFSGYSGTHEEALLSRLFSYAYDLSASDLEKHPKMASFLSATLEKIQHGALIVLEIEPSYGCYIVAIGETLHEAS